MPAKLLFLEDEPIIALDMEQVLSRAGFDVNWFTTCQSAEYWLDVNSPDIALLDIKLGDGTCQPIAQSLVDRDVPFVIHSGYPGNADFVHEVFRAGHWVSKPVDYGDLVALLNKLSMDRKVETSL